MSFKIWLETDAPPSLATSISSVWPCYDDGSPKEMLGKELWSIFYKSKIIGALDELYDLNVKLGGQYRWGWESNTTTVERCFPGKNLMNLIRKRTNEL